MKVWMKTSYQDPTAKTDLLSFLELAQHQSKVIQQWFVWTDTLHTLDVMQVQKNPELFHCSQKASVNYDSMLIQSANRDESNNK